MAIPYSKAALLLFISLAIVKEYKAAEPLNVTTNGLSPETATTTTTTTTVTTTTTKTTTTNPNATGPGTAAAPAPTGQDCRAIHTNNPTATSGVYQVAVARALVQVYCDMTTEGGGWTVFQRRGTNTTNFHQNWDTYAVGFGDVSDEFWLGNDKIHSLTAGRFCVLRIEMEDWDGATGYATYQDFSIDGGVDKYLLHIGTYSGNRGDSLAYHNGKPFSTYDRDVVGTTRKCAREEGGAWWHGGCGGVALNGVYHDGAYTGINGIHWFFWRNTHEFSLKKTAMKLRCSN